MTDGHDLHLAQPHTNKRPGRNIQHFLVTISLQTSRLDLVKSYVFGCTLAP
jgi:hypothetical protein